MRRMIQHGLFAAVVWAAAASTALAQGALVHGTVAAAASDGQTGAAFGGGVTYRFNRVVGLGVELTHVRSLPSNYPSVYCCGNTGEGRATAFTTNVRIEMPTLSARVIPFVIGGGGVAGVTRSFDVWYAALASQVPSLVSQLPALGLSVLPGPRSIETTSTSLALTLGGGASFLVTDHFAIDADLRVLHLMESDTGRNIGRFGGGVSYRF